MDTIIKQINKRDFYRKQDFLNRNFIRQIQGSHFKTLAGKHIWKFANGSCIVLGRGSFSGIGILIPPTEDYVKVKTVKEMKILCRRNGLKNYSNLRKKQIEKLLETRTHIMILPEIIIP